MPSKLWGGVDDVIDVNQRESRYHEAADEIDRLDDANAKQAEVIAALVDVIESKQWRETYDEDGEWIYSDCPWCEGDKPTHKKDCKREAALAMAKEI